MKIPAHKLLRKVWAHKEENNRDQLISYEYESYNKLEFDLTNISPKFMKYKFFKPFAFVFKNMDSTSTNEKPFLPAFITESLSDVYYKKEGDKKREVVKATKISGVDNQSVNQFLGDMYQTTNVYDNFIYLFGKGFVSPISTVGLLYYRYYLVDSAFIGDKWCYKLTFKPRRQQDLVFVGEMWINDTTFAVQKVNMRICKDANINFVNDIAIVKEYDKVYRDKFMLTKELLVINFAPIDSGVGFIGRKSTSYRKFKVNEPRPDDFFKSNENVVIAEDADKHGAEYWAAMRHDSLAGRERKIYHMIDTIKSLPVYQTYVSTITTIFTGYKDFGQVEVGPYFKLYSFNPVEGNRFRIGVRTYDLPVKNLNLNGYVAYGTLDEKFKYGGGGEYFVSKKPYRQSFKVNFSRDIEQLNSGKSIAFQESNLLTSVLRRTTVSKLSFVDAGLAGYHIEWFDGFSNEIDVKHAFYRGVGDLNYNYYSQPEQKTILNTVSTSEVILYARYQYLQRYLESNHRRISLGSPYPALQFQYILGVKGPLNGQFNYHKFIFKISDKVYLSPFGYTQYVLEAGKIIGTLPFALLEVHPGNETYTYDNNAFNLMNYYEFISDTYVSLFVTHHFGGFFFDKVPLFRKLKWREVVAAKTVVGTLSDANKALMVPGTVFFTPTKPYLEAAVGIENIFKLIRIDAIWRLSYLDNPNIVKFGIRGNLQVLF